MTCFTPTVALGLFLPKPTTWSDQLGGLPWGLPAPQWPLCTECNTPQTFLAQFRHHPHRLDLGKKGRVLFLFQCEQDCPSWEMNGGANAVIILDECQLTVDSPLLGDQTINTLPELRVTRWEAQADSKGTKLQGTPTWIQGEEDPPAPYTFAGQIDSVLSFTQDIPLEDPRIEQHNVNGFESLRITPDVGKPFWVSVREEQYHCDFANFGDMGMGYLFVHPDPIRPSGTFTWQSY